MANKVKNVPVQMDARQFLKLKRRYLSDRALFYLTIFICKLGQLIV